MRYCQIGLWSSQSNDVKSVFIFAARVVVGSIYEDSVILCWMLC